LDKIKIKFHEYSKKYGKNTFSLSQALCFVGDDKHTSTETKWLLRDTGTFAIDYGLVELLSKDKIALSSEFRKYY
jgi:hypothetical protein